MDTSTNEEGIINQIYDLRSNFSLIGLTGRTGSGCSTVAKLLSNETFEEFNPPIPEYGDDVSNDSRKYRIVYNYLKNNWKQYTVIRVSDIITLFVLNNNYEKLLAFIEEYNQFKFSEEFKKLYEEIYNDAAKVIDFIENKKYKEESTGNNDATATPEFVIDFMEKKLKNFSTSLKNELFFKEKSRSFGLFQIWGDNIRETGSAIRESTILESSLVVYINRLIKIYRIYDEKNKRKVTRIVIDSLRNPYEIMYFRERYSAFYTISVNTKEEDRKSRLYKEKFDEDSIKKLDDKEYPEEEIFRHVYLKQNLQKCIELSDIHIVNKDDDGEDKYYLKRQLVSYLSLMMHPGIIQPTPVERTMQIAYTAKLNSGCISRQVGAAITDNRFSLKSIGWNNTPEGQTPCALRSLDDLLSMNDRNGYSKYEFSHKKFRESIKPIKEELKKKEDILRGRNLSYCFKDIQNIVENKKNQVHTRSLHAEENAFLQISKYGGGGLIYGKLFTTASPCELCAKKAYQIGIKEIYYIDPYPGISSNHILDCGSLKPKLVLFEGAIGRAYFHLYHPLLMYKDELAIYIDVKSIIKKNTKKDILQEKNEVLEKEIEALRKEIETLRKKKIRKK